LAARGARAAARQGLAHRHLKKRSLYGAVRPERLLIFFAALYFASDGRDRLSPGARSFAPSLFVPGGVKP
jgi:hypothetical protein